MITYYNDPVIFLKVVFSQLSKWKRNCCTATKTLKNNYQVITPFRGPAALLTASNRWGISRTKVLFKRGVPCLLVDCNERFLFSKKSVKSYPVSKEILGGRGYLVNRILLYPGHRIDTPERLTTPAWINIISRGGANIRYLSTYFGGIPFTKIPKKNYDQQIMLARILLGNQGFISQDVTNFIRNTFKMEFKNVK